MTNAAEVFLWGTRIGVVVQDGAESVTRFQYDPKFLEAGVEPSPLTMPVSSVPYSFPELSAGAFHGLPGLLADSVPDKFGNALIDAWLVRQGRASGDFSAVERLCYTGRRGMGALEYKPALRDGNDRQEEVDVAALVKLASEVLAARAGAGARIEPGADDLAAILRVGTSAGGARAKALVAWNEQTNEIRSGQVPAPDGFGYWLLKLDGVAENGDKEGADAAGYGRIEYAYSLMAKAAGIDMADCRLLDEGPRHHFITRRFDRLADGSKLHTQTLGALAHFDYNLAGAYSYEQAATITRRLVNDARAEEQLFRRAVFNILAWNCDDHVKNISFVMDRRGVWSLAPAYDLMFSYNPGGAWTSRHQMTLNGKRSGFTRKDFLAFAGACSISAGRARSLIDEVAAAIKKFPVFAASAEMPRRQVAAINRVIN